MRKSTAMILALLLIITLTSSSKIFPEKANASSWGTIYIRADGSIEPEAARAVLDSLDNVTYYMKDNINSTSDGIVIERNYIILDGHGYKIRNMQPTGCGIVINDRTNITVLNLTHARTGYTSENDSILVLDSTNISIHDCKFDSVNWNAIRVDGSSNIRIYNNEFSPTLLYGIDAAVWANSCSNVYIYRNKIVNTYDAIKVDFGTAYVYKNEIRDIDFHAGWFSSCDYAVFAYNNITGNSQGISLYSSNVLIHLNTIVGGIWTCPNCHNNNITRNNIVATPNSFHLCSGCDFNSFTNNNFTAPAPQIDEDLYNALNNSYPSCGNYWSIYTGQDLKHGPNQDQLGPDGIGDSPFVPHPNYTEVVDHYPFMYPFNLTMDVTGIGGKPDGIVNMRDVAAINVAYGTQPGDPHWNWFADVNGDALIDGSDIQIVLKYFLDQFYATD